MELEESLNVGGFISKITFNDDTELSIMEDSIVVFVGPNNVGKSQALKDLYELLEEKKPTTVIRDIELQKTSESLLPSFFKKISSVVDNGSHKIYEGFGFTVNSYQIQSYADQYSYGTSIRDVFSILLDTQRRLSIVDPPLSINRDSSKTHPIHYAAFIPECRKRLSANFRKAFNTDIIPDKTFGELIPLRLGDSVDVGGPFADMELRIDAYAKLLSEYKQAHLQGDGIKSFIGILLYLMIDHYRVFLIDEPESFLHPPQAEIMGRAIGESLNSAQQAFLSTHSKDLIKGLLDTCSERLIVVRITREEDVNSFTILKNEVIKAIWADPLLRHSEIMDSLFHKNVALCESDSDCMMYSIINTALDEEAGYYSETLFIHCGGKHRMPDVVRTLKKLGVEVTIVVDIDILDDAGLLQRLFESCDGNWADVSELYESFSSSLERPTKEISRSYLKESIVGALDCKAESYVSEDELKAIKSMLKYDSKWSRLKSCGESGLFSGQQTTQYFTLKNALEGNRIYVVPCGELEGFVKEVGGHGPRWVNAVLEKFPNIENEVYDEIKKYVRKWK